MAGRIRVLPADLTFQVDDGESVFVAARRQGVRWPSVCQGRQEADRLALGLKANEPRARLACRNHLHGDVTVSRRGVRPHG